MRQRSKRWLGLGLAALAATALADGPMSVQVKTGQMRDTPSFFGKLISPITYGEQVQILEQKGDWSRITAPGGQTGWVHSSALTKKMISMKAGEQNAQTGASGDELTLAGRGFNEDVEKAFKAQNQGVDFTWVDKMEKMNVGPEAMQRLLTEGGIHPVEGAKP